MTRCEILFTLCSLLACQPKEHIPHLLIPASNPQKSTSTTVLHNCSFVPQIFNCNMTLTCNVSSQSLLPPRYTGLHYCCLAIKEIFVPIGNACLDEGLLFLWNAAGNTCFSSITLALNPDSSALLVPKARCTRIKLHKENLGI
jgi:hypothetical protein